MSELLFLFNIIRTYIYRLFSNKYIFDKKLKVNIHQFTT